MPDPTLQAHQLEQVDDLESWIIIYLKLVSTELTGPCGDAGKQAAWHGNTPLSSRRASPGSLPEYGPRHADHLLCAQTALDGLGS